MGSNKINRRDFIKNVVKGGTAVTLGGGLVSDIHGSEDKYLKGKNIDIMDTLSAEEFLNVDRFLWYGFDMELIKKKKLMRDYSVEGLSDIIGFLNGEKPLLEERFSLDNYFDLPFRLALYAAANSRVQASWSVKGSSREEHAKEYKITPSGEAVKGSVDEYCSFVEVPPNSEINDYLIFTGNYRIRGEKRNIEVIYEFGPPLKSRIQNPHITGIEAFNFIRGIIESYRYRICANLESKIAQLK